MILFLYKIQYSVVYLIEEISKSKYYRILYNKYLYLYKFVISTYKEIYFFFFFKFIKANSNNDKIIKKYYSFFRIYNIYLYRLYNNKIYIYVDFFEIFLII